jgi:hypothetical protein
MKGKKIEVEELLTAIAEAVDDGFCPASRLASLSKARPSGPPATAGTSWEASRSR